VQLSTQAGPGGAVRQVHLDLDDPQALAQQVDGEPGFHPPAVGQRPGRLERGPGQAALPVQRLGRPPAGGPADAGPGQADDQAVAAELDGGGEDGHGHVGLAGDHRLGQRPRPGGRTGQVRVEEQQMPRAVAPLLLVDQADRLGTGLHRGALSPVPRVPHHGRAGPLGQIGGPVRRTVVYDDDQPHAGQPGRRRHRGMNSVRLIPGRDDDRDITGTEPC
jgi:hypothetical protein